MYVALLHSNDFENRDYTTQVIAVSTDIPKLQKACEQEAAANLERVLTWTRYGNGMESQYMSFGNEKSMWYEIREVQCL